MIAENWSIVPPFSVMNDNIKDCDVLLNFGEFTEFLFVCDFDS